MTYYYINTNNKGGLELRDLQDTAVQRSLKIKGGGKDKPGVSVPEFEACDAYNCHKH